MDKDQIASEIKAITKVDVEYEWFLLKDLKSDEIKDTTSLGNKIIDFYFFKNRLETKGNKGISFYDFLEYKKDYVSKPYFQKLVNYAKAHNRYKDSEIKFLYYCYGLCFGRISAFKIPNALMVYDMFDVKCVLDAFAGFGSRCLGAMLKGIDYIGIDMNINLKDGYERMLHDFNGEHNSLVKLFFQDCLTLDFSQFKYDMVFTSPPYYNIEQYPYQPKRTKDEWDDFYFTVFNRLWDNLSKGGTFAINVNQQIYQRVLVPLFDEPDFSFRLNIKQKGEYTENVYIWIK
jgi:hypothetical protein